MNSRLAESENLDFGVNPDAMSYSFYDVLNTQRMFNYRCSSLVAPKQIIYSGNRTIVFWNDGGKTIVKCAESQEYDEYTGFVAALAKKMYGSTSKVKKIIDKTKKNQD